MGGKYQVSTKGRIRNASGKILKPRSDRMGYKRVDVYTPQGRKTIGLHRLTALTHLPRKRGQTQVNHKYKNKNHNSIHRVEWMSQKENLAHQHSYKVKKHIRKRKNGASAVIQHKRTSR